MYNFKYGDLILVSQRVYTTGLLIEEIGLHAMHVWATYITIF